MCTHHDILLPADLCIGIISQLGCAWCTHVVVQLYIFMHGTPVALFNGCVMCTMMVTRPSVNSYLLSAFCIVQIVELPEYYPYRTELSMLNQHMPSIIDHIAPGSVVVELGCGSATKTSLIINALLERQALACSCLYTRGRVSG